jgi:hypothetical protein
MTSHITRSENFNANGSISISIKLGIPLTNNHIACAWICTKKCIEIERTYQIDKNNEDNPFGEDLTFVCCALVTSVTYLESFINEFFNNCENDADSFKVITKEKNELLKKYRKTKEKCQQKEKYSKILCKYQAAYRIINEIGIDESSEQFKDVDDLIHLRNSIVHDPSKLQHTHNFVINDDSYGFNHLEGKFPKNVFNENIEKPFFPYQCLGAGCAKWAIQTSIEFTEFFCSGINLKPDPTVHKILEELLTF